MDPICRRCDVNPPSSCQMYLMCFKGHFDGESGNPTSEIFKKITLNFISMSNGHFLIHFTTRFENSIKI